ncbi:phosphate ABC transporter permease subunit PstC [Acholeplasma laidlawii]|nr:phosphate ABC transporter permease subunit PstC [Acholeplasma laidlawii]
MGYMTDISNNIKHHNKLIDKMVRGVLYAFTIASASFIFIIVGVIIVKGITPFVTYNQGLGRVDFFRFITGDTWLTGTAFQSNLYSIGFIIVSTIFIALLSLLISLPIGVMTALFIARVAPKKLSETFRTIIEILASIPSIIFGLFGATIIKPFVYNLSAAFGYQSKGGNSMLATILVLAIMTIPTIASISEVAIRSVNQKIVNASLALGATKSQTNFKVVLTAAKSGIFASAILGIGRALGEATAVSLVAGGRKSGFSFDILDTTSTLTSIMLEGMKETTGIDYDIRFSVGIILMVIILLTNAILNFIKKKVGNIDVK